MGYLVPSVKLFMEPQGSFATRILISGRDILSLAQRLSEISDIMPFAI